MTLGGANSNIYESQENVRNSGTEFRYESVPASAGVRQAVPRVDERAGFGREPNPRSLRGVRSHQLAPRGPLSWSPLY